MTLIQIKFSAQYQNTNFLVLVQIYEQPKVKICTNQDLGQPHKNLAERLAVEIFKNCKFSSDSAISILHF